MSNPLSEPVAPANKESTMAKLELGPVNHGTDKNRYCGPSVISAVTSLTTGEAARLIRLQSGKRSVKGTSTLEVKRALKACNVQMRTVHPPDGEHFGRSYGITLAHWLRLTHGTRADRVFLVVAGWHWQLISGNRYVCGRIASLGIVSTKHHKVKRRARVAEVYELTSNHVTRPSMDVRKPNTYNASRSKATRLAKKWGIEIEVFPGDTFKNVWPPESISDEDDPFDGEHCTHSWGEALEMVERYVKILQERLPLVRPFILAA